PLYGHELHEQIDPISAGCAWCVDLTKDFIGAPAIRAVAAAGPKRKLVGLVLDGRRIARQGSAMLDSNGERMGEVTSGTLSPTLGSSIAMGYVESRQSGEGTHLEVEIGTTRAAAKVVPLPFYKRPAS